MTDLETEIANLRGALAAQQERDDAAAQKAGIPPQGCDTSDQLADEVLALRAQLKAAQAAVEKWHASDHGEVCWVLAENARAAAQFGCTCGSDDNNRDRAVARAAVGLEVK